MKCCRATRRTARLAGIFAQDRNPVRQGPADLGDGSRHSHRCGAGGDATGRSAGLLSVGTPKGRLSKLEKALLDKPWQAVREGVDVKVLPQDQETYVFAQSRARIHKERAMRRRKLKWLWSRLKQIANMKLTRKEFLMKLGAARSQGSRAWRLIDIDIAPSGLRSASRSPREVAPGAST